ncbi:carbohydrate ABC transporter permease [uncultured Alsobacter sp.]|uniref:carbohydrate ABC transporter permease n=1 Tax=uncultured Alsobacter sp. TaxID=1748258 RepID=UPI0025DB86D4|nr:sugar ABC transporter permease [uncultured Alsobacter sp.]
MSAGKTTESLLTSRWTPYVFMAPVFLYLLLFDFIPLVKEFYLSFTSTSLLTPSVNKWVGLDNYRELFSNRDFLHSLWITAVYTIACVVLAIGAGLGTALLLDAPFLGRAVARTLVTLPWAAPPVAVALIFTWIYNAQYGVFNYVQRSLGIETFENWLDTPDHALTAILIATIWQIFPFSSVVILAALQGVPKELRESAALDGAGAFDIFRAVVWPTIRPTVMLLALFITIWSLRRFDLIWLLTQGGPIGATNTLVIDLYRRAFVYRDLGAGASVGMVGLCIAFAITLVHHRLSSRYELKGR